MKKLDPNRWDILTHKNNSYRGLTQVWKIAEWQIDKSAKLVNDDIKNETNFLRFLISSVFQRFWVSVSGHVHRLGRLQQIPTRI